MPILTRRTANVVAAFLALALVAGLVIRTSSAIFNAQTNNVGNSLEAGTVVLTDDDGASFLFDMDNVAPGEFAVECIRVAYEGTLDPERVSVYSTSEFVTTADDVPPGDAAANMQDQVLITIEEGNGTNTGSGFDDCPGAPADFNGTTITGPDETLTAWNGRATDYDSGDGAWNPGPAPDQSRVYQVTLRLEESTGNEFQGARLSGIRLEWGTESTNSPGEIDPR